MALAVLLRGAPRDLLGARVAHRRIGRTAVLGTHAPALDPHHGGCPAHHPGRSSHADPACVAPKPRRRFLRLVTQQPWSRDAGAVLAFLTSPWTAALVFLVDLYLWHWDVLFNLTLRNQAVHDLEHVCFLSTALLLWSQIIDQKPIHARMTYLARAGYILLVGAAGNLLAMYFVFAQRPLYAQYANLFPRPFGMGALMDQQLAGALMWVPVLFVFAIAFCICLYKWLGDEQRSTEVGTVPAYRLLDGSLSSEVIRR